jgi:hypothetical protein
LNRWAERFDWCYANEHSFLQKHGQSCKHALLISNVIVTNMKLRIQAILLFESFKLVPRPLNEGPRLKRGKLRLNLHGTYFREKINWFRPKDDVKGKARDLENQ